MINFLLLIFFLVAGVLLRAAIEPRLAAKKYAQLSQDLRSLIELSSTRDSAWRYYTEASHVIQQGAAYPQQELYWLVATSWNNGIYFSRISEKDNAERWMGMVISAFVFKSYLACNFIFKLFVIQIIFVV